MYRPFGKSHCSRGYSLLEVSLTLPILIIFIIGAIDINTGYQAYNAVREGVRTANRCTWATDGDCSVVNSDPLPGQPYFNWEARTPGEDTSYGYKFRYWAEGHHMLNPIYRIGDFEAEVLGDISYEWQEHSRNFQERAFPAEGILPRIYQARLPHLQISRAVGGRPNVQATYLRQPGRAYTNNINYSTSGNPSLSWSGTRSGSVRFSIERPRGSVCRESTNFNRQGNHEPSSQRCRDSAGFDPNEVEAMILVYANDGGSTAGSNGQIAMSISGPGISGRLSLGGRQYSTWDDASLCPRVPRVGTNFVSQSGCNESAPGHHGLPTLQYDRQYTLHFDLENVTGDLHWDFESLRLYLPRISEGWNNWRECQDPIKRSEFDDNPVCRRPNGDRASLVQWLNEEEQPHNGVVTDDFSVEIDPDEAVYGLFQADCSLVQTNVEPAPSSQQCVDWFEVDSTSEEESVPNKPCGSNFGINLPVTPENLRAAADECIARWSPEEPRPPAHATITSVTQTTLPLPHIPDVLWERQNCLDNNIPLPSELMNYPNNDYSTTFEKHSEPRYTGSNDPRPMVANDPMYSCNYNGGSHATGSVRYDKDSSGEEFFQKYHFDTVVGCTEDDLTQTVRGHAIDAGLHHDSYYEAGAFDEEPVVAPISMDRYNQFLGTECLVELVLGEPEAVVATVNGDCENVHTSAPVHAYTEGEVVWTRELGGFCGVEGADYPDTPSLPTPLEAEARARFFQRVQTLYPAARLGCEGENCVQFGAPAGVDRADRSHLAEWEGTIEVPLLSANLINFFTGERGLFNGATKFTLRTDETRTFETQFVR